jgi:hypothetical protein
VLGTELVRTLGCSSPLPIAGLFDEVCWAPARPGWALEVEAEQGYPTGEARLQLSGRARSWTAPR